MRLAVLIGFLFATLAWPGTVRAHDDAPVNRLLVEAMKTWDEAADADVAFPSKLRLVQEVSAKLEAILSDHPDTEFAVTLLAGGEIGSLSLKRVRLMAEKLERCVEGQVVGCDTLGAYFRRDGDPLETIMVVAVKTPLSRGDVLTYEIAKQVLKFVEWPRFVLPDGVFVTARDMFGPDLDKVLFVTKDMAPGELLLRHRISVGPTAAENGREMPPVPAQVLFKIAVGPKADIPMPGDRVNLRHSMTRDGQIVERDLLGGVLVAGVGDGTIEVLVRESDLVLLWLAEDTGELSAVAAGAEEQ